MTRIHNKNISIHHGISFGRICQLIRVLYTWFLINIRHRLRFKSYGKGLAIGGSMRVRPDSVSIGDYCYIGPNCYLNSKIRIGNWVMISADVAMVGGDHNFTTVGVPSIWAGREENKEIIIHDDVWVGQGAIIMHGITIGEGAIIAAGAIVTRNVPAYAIVGSPPAQIIGYRFKDEDQELHHRELTKLRI